MAELAVKVTTVDKHSARVSEAFAKSIRDLLEKHKLSYRQVGIRVGNLSARSYLSDWVMGRVPQFDYLKNFLSHFPVEDAREVLTAAGYPIPEEWLSSDPVKRVEIALADAHPTPLQLQQIKEYLKKFEQ